MYNRLGLLFFIILLSFIAVILRLFYWQVLTFQNLKGMAVLQTKSSYTLKAKRGQIFDRNGEPLVINQKAYLMYVEPDKIDNYSELVSNISENLEVESATISAKIDKNLKWIKIAEKVDQEIKEKLSNKNLNGLGFEESSKRYYPEASMSAHLLGFVGSNEKGTDQGYFGIEGFYDQLLKGRDGEFRQEKDAKGNPILQGKIFEISPEDGRDLFLTLDKTVQYIVEDKLLKGLEKYGAKGGSIIVMDPQTGEIYAMASYPAYDPQNYYIYPQEYYKNPGINFFYEPGSTFKVLIVAAALNEGKINADTIIDESGPIKIGGYEIKTWNQEYHGAIDIAKVLQYSSNVGMVDIQKKLGDNNTLRYIEKLGFGKKTGIDLQDESTPLLRNKNNWYEIDYATSSFGQGIAVTPIQMVRAVASIANGGKLIKPYIVKKIVSKEKTIVLKPDIVDTVYNSTTTSIVKEMMISAVDNGEARYAKPKGYRIAGKTGTAQIPISGHYDTEKTIASFIGFAPADNPKFLMLVTLIEPTSSPWGSETAAPLFFTISKDLFSYWGISPS
jgi:cell division protein FtsI/penicillin-binding protein 2